MCDPVGVISLGIEVCSGLVSYYDSYRSHDSYVARVCANLNGLHTILLSVQEILDGFQFTESMAQVVHERILACRGGMAMLEEKLQKCKATQLPDGIRGGLQSLRRRVLFPFHRVTLQELETTVDALQKDLGLALQALQLASQVYTVTLIHDLHPKLDSVRSCNLEASLSITANEERFERLLEKVENLNGLLETIPRTAIARVISKPDHFRSICESYTEVQPYCGSPTLDLLSTVYGDDSKVDCACKVRVVRKSLRASPDDAYRRGNPARRWNVIWQSASIKHDRACPSSMRKNSAGFTFSYCGAILACAVHMMFQTRTGAGGWGISPDLFFTPIVASDSPGFALLDIKFQRWQETREAEKVFDLAIEKLKRLFREGKASARDVDQAGNTLLHKACDIFGQVIGRWRLNVSFAFYHNHLEFLRKLHIEGVDLNRSNEASLTCLNKIAAHYVQVYQGPTGEALGFSPEITDKISVSIARMIDMGAEFHEVTSKSLPEHLTFNQEGLVPEMIKLPDLAEAFCCNEISKAVLLRSENILKAAITKDRDSINEPNSFGQTPLHLSVDWSIGVKILIEAGANVGHPDGRGTPPLWYALETGNAESVRLFVEAQCALYAPTSNSDILETVIAYGWSVGERSLGTVDAIIKLVAHRRQQLQRLILTKLPASRLDKRLLRIDRVLDEYDYLACSVLRQHDIAIPPSLLPSPRRRTAYHNEHLTLRTADSLWHAGFRDIDGLDAYGQTTLMVLRMDRCLTNLEKYLKLVSWFLSKGANIHTIQAYHHQSKNGDDQDLDVADFGTTSANIPAVHIIARVISRSIFRDLMVLYASTPCLQKFREKLLTLNNETRTAFKNIITDPVQDTCCCPCSSRGCRVVSLILKRFRAENELCDSLPADDLQILQRWTFIMIDCIMELLSEMVVAADSVWQQISADLIRLFTFEELGLRHSCCRWHRGKVVEYEDPADISEIHSEDREKLEILEELLPEFETKQRELASPISQFLRGYWRLRMDEVLREQEVIDEKELQRLGVVLQETKLPFKPSPDQEYDEDDSDKYFSRLYYPSWWSWDDDWIRDSRPQVKVEMAERMVENMRKDLPEESSVAPIARLGQ